MNTRLASYSKLYVKGKTSAKAIKQAIKDGQPFDLEVTDMFGPHAKYCGSYCSPNDIKALGVASVSIRFNQDRDVVIVKL